MKLDNLEEHFKTVKPLHELGFFLVGEKIFSILNITAHASPVTRKIIIPVGSSQCLINFPGRRFSNRMSF